MPRHSAPHSKSPANITALGFRVWRAKAPLRLPTAHTHSDVEVNFLLSGEITYIHGGGIATVKPFSFTAFWGGVPHCIISNWKETQGILITLPLAWLLEWQLPNNVPARFFGGEVLSARPDPIDLPLLERWLADFDSGHKQRRRALLLEIQARFQRLALAIPSKSTRTKRGKSSTQMGITQVGRITDYIAQHYQEPISVEQIAEAVGLHGKYLMRLFKRHSGMSAWEYVTRMRLSHAQRLLLTTDMKIIDITLEAGFGSFGPFYRAFAAYSSDFKRPLDYRRKLGVRR
jgi:AraC-like DNA-binding protein